MPLSKKGETTGPVSHQASQLAAEAAQQVAEAAQADAEKAKEELLGDGGKDNPVQLK